MEQTITTGGSDGKSNLCAKSNANRSVVQADKIVQTDKIMQVPIEAELSSCIIVSVSCSTTITVFLRSRKCFKVAISLSLSR